MATQRPIKSLSDLMDGGVEERFNAALAEVWENVYDPNTDDGISQVITTKQGVSMAQNVVFQNPVPLKPMRTFTEVDQPESNFTLRVDEDANCALYEADGGAWKNEAVINIHDYLKNNLYGQNIVVLA